MVSAGRPRFGRLKHYWESKGFRSASDFADFLEVGRSHISDIDKKETPAVLLQALSLKTDLNLHWLLTGNGSMAHDPLSQMPEQDSAPSRTVGICRNQSRQPIIPAWSGGSMSTHKKYRLRSAGLSAWCSVLIRCTCSFSPGRQSIAASWIQPSGRNCSRS